MGGISLSLYLAETRSSNEEFIKFRQLLGSVHGRRSREIMKGDMVLAEISNPVRLQMHLCGTSSIDCIIK